METHFNKVRNYILELEFDVTHENEEEGIIVIKKEGTGIQNLVIGCADPILIMEQFLFAINNVEVDTLSALLKKNRDIVHGAFVLDETGSKVIFRDTLQLENLDLNELEGSINSLSLLLAEYSDQLITFSKN
jgi:hypothetical protein